MLCGVTDQLMFYIRHNEANTFVMLDCLNSSKVFSKTILQLFTRKQKIADIKNGFRSKCDFIKDLTSPRSTFIRLSPYNSWLLSRELLLCAQVYFRTTVCQKASLRLISTFCYFFNQSQNSRSVEITELLSNWLK